MSNSKKEDNSSIKNARDMSKPGNLFIKSSTPQLKLFERSTQKKESIVRSQQDEMPQKSPVIKIVQGGANTKEIKEQSDFAIQEMLQLSTSDEEVPEMPDAVWKCMERLFSASSAKQKTSESSESFSFFSSDERVSSTDEEKSSGYEPNESNEYAQLLTL